MPSFGVEVPGASTLSVNEPPSELEDIGAEDSTLSGATYVVALDYCSDHIEFDATIVAPPGDPAAVADALDDMIDRVRSQCATRSPAGRKYLFLGVGGYTTITSGDLEVPAVVATIGADRQVD